MAEPLDPVTERVADRVEMLRREVLEVTAKAGEGGDPIVRIQAQLDAHWRADTALVELVTMLAAEIDRLRLGLFAPPS